MKFALLACWLCVAQIRTSAGLLNTGPVVSVTGGKVRGTLTDFGGAVFRGIPYAQPPMGELRWREPLPVKPWSAVRDATDFGPPCVQGGARGARSNEDCLYLNVWTPVWPAKSPAAVMVWVHGGGNFAGASSEPTFDGKNLARHGVLLVSFNYRLGVFGFFAHPELTKESPHHSSGNYGLLDQILALRWVQDNISSFGGDPGKVTVFGESAGSLDINVLMASPLSKGLFQRVIGESGPVVAPPPLAEAERKGEALAARLNASGTESLKRLRALPSAELQQATGQGLAFLGPTLGVVVDGWVFPESPMKVFAGGHEHHVALLLGSNAQELQRPFFGMHGDLRQAITQQYGALADHALLLYGLNGGTEPKPDPELGPVQAQWATDSQFRCGSVVELMWHTSAGNRGYQFQFSVLTPGKESVGAFHGSEVPFVFGTLGVGAVAPRYNATDQQVSAVIQEYWTDFAKTGDPNGGNLPRWQSFDPTSRAYLDFTDAGPLAKKGLRRQTCDLYAEKLKQDIGP